MAQPQAISMAETRVSRTSAGTIELAPISDKLKALLAIAEQVQIDGKKVTKQLVEEARQHGATDLDIHDTVLISAAFCMYNRYVDGLQTWQPRNDAMYIEMGKRMAQEGYCSRVVPAALSL